MHSRNYQDILGGAVLILIGAAAAIYALATLRIGTISQMGPGMFPAAIGGILAVFGLAILIPALFRPGEMLRMDVRSFTAILVSILAFAAMVRPFGMVPAIAVLTLIASRADSRLSPLGTALVAAGLCLCAILIFRIGLSVPIAIIAWPW